MSPSPGWTRRALLRSLAGAGALALVGERWAQGVQARPPAVLRAAWIGPEGEPAGLGAEMGIAEAGRAAELVGRRFACERVAAAGGKAALRAARAAADAGASTLIGGGLDRAARERLAGLAEERRMLLIWAVPAEGEESHPGTISSQARLSGDAARSRSGLAMSRKDVGPGTEEKVRRHVFHVSPGWSERRSAVSRWLAGEGRGHPATGLRAVVWHPDLAAGGAAQLNRRFRERSGRPMDEGAWAGWFAVKAAAELALRGTGPGDRAARLLSLRFDGHKGAPLSFDPMSHRLHQPLYVVDAASRLLGQVPENEE